jgi:hypothetical protein
LKVGNGDQGRAFRAAKIKKLRRFSVSDQFIRNPILAGGSGKNSFELVLSKRYAKLLDLTGLPSPPIVAVSRKFQHAIE